MGRAAQSCGVSGAGTVCQSPGNVQINDAPPAANFYPYGGDAFLLGAAAAGSAAAGFTAAEVMAADTGSFQ